MAIATTSPQADPRPYWKPGELAEYLNISLRTMRTMLSGPNPTLSSVKIGGSRRIPAEAVDSYLRKADRR